MMKITFVITGLSTGGAEVMLHKVLQNIDRDRFQPTVISLIDKGEIGPRIEALGIPVYALGMRRGVPNPSVIFRLARLIQQLQPDVVHTWMYHADLLGGLAARLAGCSRVIWCLRNSNLSKGQSTPSTLIVVRLCALLSRWLPTQIVSCSQRAKEVHAAVGYANDKIHVIPNGFDLSLFVTDDSARASLCAELGLPLDAQLIGVVARYDPQKNHIGFVQAASTVLSLSPQVHFVMAGSGIDGSNAALTTAIVSHPGLKEHMHLLGRRDDIPRLMAAFDVLALPSSHGEAFPNVLGEAMACGVPCVATDVGDSGEIVGDTGHVVAVGDMDGLAQQLLQVLRLSATERASLGQLARARVRSEYEIGHVTGLYQAFYERVMEASMSKGSH